jgi:hypothetical protein
MSNKIANVKISVPYKGPGNTIRQNPVAFDVYSEKDQYKAVPVLNTDERRIANLPEELLFKCEDGKPISLRGNFDGNYHAIQSIVHELQKQNLL